MPKPGRNFQIARLHPYTGELEYVRHVWRPAFPKPGAQTNSPSAQATANKIVPRHGGNGIATWFDDPIGFHDDPQPSAVIVAMRDQYHYDWLHDVQFDVSAPFGELMMQDLCAIANGSSVLSQFHAGPEYKNRLVTLDTSGNAAVAVHQTANHEISLIEIPTFNDVLGWYEEEPVPVVGEPGRFSAATRVVERSATGISGGFTSPSWERKYFTFDVVLPSVVAGNDEINPLVASPTLLAASEKWRIGDITTVTGGLVLRSLSGSGYGYIVPPQTDVVSSIQEPIIHAAPGVWSSWWRARLAAYHDGVFYWIADRRTGNIVTEYFGHTLTVPYVIKTDAALNILWMVPATVASHLAWGMVADEHGVILGTHIATEDRTFVLERRRASDGAVMWRQSIGNWLGSSIGSMCLADNGALYVCGESTGFGP